MIPPLGAVFAAGAQGVRKGGEIEKAASDFEALLIAQMLRSMRESGGRSGWMGTGEDASADSVMELAEEQLATLLAQRGGLGLARTLTQALTRTASDKRS